MKMIFVFLILFLCQEDVFDPQKILSDASKAIIPIIKEKRDLSGNEILFLINVNKVDKQEKKISFSVNYIRMDYEFFKLKPLTFLEIDNRFVLIQGEGANILIEEFDFPKFSSSIEKRMREDLHKPTHSLSGITYRGITAAVDYNNGQREVVYYENEFNVPVEHRKYQSDFGDVRIKVISSDEFLKDSIR